MTKCKDGKCGSGLYMTNADGEKVTNLDRVTDMLKERVARVSKRSKERIAEKQKEIAEMQGGNIDLVSLQEWKKINGIDAFDTEKQELLIARLFNSLVKARSRMFMNCLISFLAGCAFISLLFISLEWIK